MESVFFFFAGSFKVLARKKLQHWILLVGSICFFKNGLLIMM